MHNRINLKKMWRDIQETLDPQQRLEKVRDAVVRVRLRLEELRDSADKLVATVLKLTEHPGNSTGASVIISALITMAFLSFGADVYIQQLLNSAAFPATEYWKVLLGSIGLAVVFAAASHGGSVLFLYDDERPRRSLRLMKWVTLTFFFVSAVAGLIVLYARQASPGQVRYLETIAVISLWIAAEGGAICGGLFSGWAHMYAHPLLEERTLRKVRRQIAGHEKLLGDLQAEEIRLTAAEGTPGPDNKPTSPVTVPIVIGMLLTIGMLLYSAVEIRAQNSGISCAAFSDQTLSEDPEHRVQALALAKERLPSFVQAFACAELVAGSFSDEGIWTPREWYEVPVQQQSQDCSSTRPPAVQGARKVIQGIGVFQEYHQDEAEARCRDQADLERSGFENEWREFARQAGAAFGQKQLAHETGTHIVSVVESLFDSDVQVILLLTDGLDTTGGLEGFAVPRSRRLILFLVPASSTYGGSQATAAAGSQWEASGAIALPYTALSSPRIWERMRELMP